MTTLLKLDDEVLTQQEFYEKMYKITTERIMELQPIRNEIDRGRYVGRDQHLFEKTWEANQYLHKYAYTMMRGLQ